MKVTELLVPPSCLIFYHLLWNNRIRWSTLFSLTASRIGVSKKEKKQTHFVILQAICRRRQILISFSCLHQRQSRCACSEDDRLSTLSVTIVIHLSYPLLPNYDHVKMLLWAEDPFPLGNVADTQCRNDRWNNNCCGRVCLFACLF